MADVTVSSVREQRLRDPEEQLRRRLWLRMPHLRPLVEVIEVIEQELGSHYVIPMPDPLDGGANARLLILLEAPGPKAAETGFISTDNPDPTANNLRELLQEAGIARSDVFMWNSIPWFLVSDEGTIRPPLHEERAKARPYLAFVLHQLPNLQTVLLMGRHAQTAWDEFGWPRPVSSYRTSHPSARGLAKPGAREKALATLKELADTLHHRSSDNA